MQQLAHKWDAKLYNDKHSYVYDYGESLIGLLDPQPNERILDLGCGSGELTCKIKELAGEVVGMDKSIDMIEKARLQYPLIDFQVGDASDFYVDKPFDAIFSNATLHWVAKYREAINCLYCSLEQGGRLVVEFGGKDNVRAITDQLCTSLLKRGYTQQAEVVLWYFPSVGEYTTALEASGFTVTFAQWYDRLTELADEQTGIKDWLAIFSRPFFTGVPDSDVPEIMNEVQERLKPKLFRNGKWYADYKRIRIVAYK
ncbi:methyltransferase domain-containing protein [Aggregatimonas sangjinii]|uniref:Methyltransferase domain-containing protein n=1 Tax=Aggregatimonas sangjinii TaxID=2583587 RepID=A0A5B7SMQ1_9FLAO|nr:methyltransferase domain-containing protein [Aggregatimonas sangjinii]QCW99845.1 methyltransferase domain-containing protein [Aggregatimonas sangjinii]